jgi:hypothetical protein
MLSPKLDPQTLPPAPGVIGSLRAGFDAITTHIGLILVPLALDLLLWFGPRMSIKKLMQPILADVGALAATSGLQAADIAAALELYREFFEQFNLLVVLRTLPVGVSSLMSGRMPLQSPLGLPTVTQVGSVAQLLGSFIMLTVVGWILGGLYFHWVAGLVLTRPDTKNTPTAARAVTQTLIYSLVWTVLAWTLALPAMLIIYVAFAINPLLGQGVLLIGGFVSLWLIVPLFFSPHGIFVRRQNALASFLGGFHLTRFTLPNSSFFVLAVFIIAIGLNFLWSFPADDSWMALVGILGHAFITTALLASSFIYYQDMSAWLQTVLARLRASMPAQQAQ